MIAKIPSALLVTRVGGLSEAHETRKFCFLFEAPKFLKQVVQEIGELAGHGTIIATPLPFRESGKVTYESQFLKLEIYEDPLLKDGLRMHFRVKSPSGAAMLSSWTPITRLAKNAALSELVHQIREELQLVKASLH